MSKTLITHINPHLDDICGIWLLKKYHPDFQDAQIDFISASRNAHLGGGTSSNRVHLRGVGLEDRVFVGTGGGRFDEHKEGLDTCAGSLVYDFLKQTGFIPSDITEKALEKLISWNRLIDTGKAPNYEFDAFSIQAFIRTKDSKDETSKKSVEMGIEILNRILQVLEKKEQSILDFEKKVEFQTIFGKSFAVISETVDREFCREQEGDLFLMYNPKYKSTQFFTPSFEIDLKSLYEKLKQVDPEASWFLHQSHHMVICGSSSAPDSEPTKLSFEQLIEVAKSIS